MRENTKTLQDWISEKTRDVPDVGSIPLEYAGIGWEIERRGRQSFSKPIEDLHVVDLRGARNRNSAVGRLWMAACSTDGATNRGWAEGDNPRQTPLGKLAEMAFDGNLPKGGFMRLLHEFAKIEGCDWALHMIAALRMGDWVVRDEEWSVA
jgi:hypothetical protein